MKIMQIGTLRPMIGALLAAFFALAPAAAQPSLRDGAGNVIGAGVLQPISAAVTMQSAAVANGNGVVLPVTGYGSAIVDAVCSVACSGGTTINFEATDSTGTFFAVQGTPLGGGSAVTSATAGGQWIFNVAGLTSLRARISAYSAGTITVTGVASTASAGGGSGGGGGSVTQGTSPWVNNVTQVGGSNVSLGQAAPTASIPVIESTVSHASATALGNSLVAKASSGNLLSFNCTGITGGAAGYCVAYNGTAAPGTGALTGANVLDVCWFDSSARGCSLTHLDHAVAFGTGIVILVTSAATPFTYTTGTDTAFISADYN